MKIGLYVPGWPPGLLANGIVTYAGTLVPALRQAGHEVFVLTSNLQAEADPYTIDLNKISVESLKARVLARISRGRSPREVVADQIVAGITVLKSRYDLDVLEIEESFGWCTKIAQSRIVPVVVRLHGPWFLNGRFDNTHEFPSRINREGSGIQAATLVTAPSKDVLLEVRRHYNLALGSAQVIPNPIEASDDVSSWKLQHCNTNQLLFVGRFDRRKGADTVLQAFANLADHHRDLRLTFIGPDNGICEQGSHLSFEQFVHMKLPASCRSRIDFHGQLSSRDIQALRTKTFLTIVASQFEILPYSVLEAMSVGCPIVASCVGGIPELITDGKNGKLFESKNVRQLAAACQQLLENHALAESLGAQVRKDCIALLNPRQVALDTVSAYQTAIELFGAQ